MGRFVNRAGVVNSMGSRWVRVMVVLILPAVLSSGATAQTPAATTFEVSFAADAHPEPVTGRVFVVVSPDSMPEPRLQAGSFFGSAPFFGADVSALAPGRSATIDGSTPGFPVERLSDLPAGDYFVQAILNVYTEFHRSDGHTIWAHMDQWEGQQFNRSPANLYSAAQKVHLDPARGYRVRLSMDQVIPPLRPPADTRWVKHVKIRSDLLSDFWGHPFYLGATVLLPEGYDEHPDARYPVVFLQGHFGLRSPYGFTPDSSGVSPETRARLDDLNRETGYEFYRSWVADDFPRMIVVTFQHPTPYFDDSYAVNSENNGPYGDALLQELIPYLESRFRMIGEPWARVLTGGSTGGWECLALQVLHPEFFGGVWSLYPDPVDLRHNQLVDSYADTSAFILAMPSRPFQPVERPMMRSADGQPLQSVRAMSHLEAVLGSHCRSGQQFCAWFAAYGPVGDDGYPVPLWDLDTGQIRADVAAFMRDNGYDLRAHLARNWDAIGPSLVDKIHVDVGDMDTFYLNLAVYDLEAFLQGTSSPSAHATFRYGRPGKAHGWQHTTTANLLREMAAFMIRHAPLGADTRAWRY